MADHYGCLFMETSALSGENVYFTFELLARQIMSHNPDSLVPRATPKKLNFGADSSAASGGAVKVVSAPAALRKPEGKSSSTVDLLLMGDDLNGSGLLDVFNASAPSVMTSTSATSATDSTAGLCMQTEDEMEVVQREVRTVATNRARFTQGSRHA